MSIELKKLQNGSDIRGISLSGVSGQIPNLTFSEAEKIGNAFLLWLCKKTGKTPASLTISLGRDPRLSGEELLAGLVSGLLDAKTYDCGLASTPAMFMSTIFPEFNCDGAIMITASHLPYNRNGFKFFCKDGGLQKEDISKIIEYAENSTFEGSEQQQALKKSPKKLEETGLMDRYCQHLRHLISDALNEPLPLKNLKIAVDAGNGSGGFFATKVLKPLGADISSSKYLEPDGTFPNHIPNPEDKEAITDICTTVLNSGSDLGLIFDTDVDRSAAVDEKGNAISRNGIVALASLLVSETHLNSTVVTDSITSNELTDFLEKIPMKHFRYKRGYKNVINKSMEINDSFLAIETSGHAAFRDNYFLDDGAYLATQVVIKVAKLARKGLKISHLLSSLKTPVEEREVRMDITAQDFSAYGDMIISKVEEWGEESLNMKVVKPNYEGVRIEVENGWFLLRKSLHDPIMPLNIESNQVGGVSKISKKIKAFLKAFENLNIENL